MKVFFKFASFLVLPALIAGCGGVDDLFGKPDMAACTGGISPFKVVSGTWTTTSASNIVDSCNLGITPADLMGDREISNDPNTATIRVGAQVGSSNLVDLGVGKNACNNALLEQPATSAMQAGCTYTFTRSSQTKVTADNQMTINFYEKRTMHGGNCAAKTDCEVRFVLDMKKK